MPTAPHRLALSLLLTLGMSLALVGACYQSPRLDGYYTCAEDSECGDGGLVCDDGVCCSERGAPLCVGRVLDGGTYYRDEDNDGYGDTSQPRGLCRPSPGWVAAPDDCQPLNARVHPNAVEECNAVDDDCDTYADENVATTWYRDADEDGFGRREQQRQACAQPSGFVINPDDCDDTNAGKNPDARDVCDGTDNNCSGGIDERPDCGGPANLLALTATRERGAVDTLTSFSGVTQGCLRHWDGGIPESFSANNVWSGSRPQSHVVWFEADGAWDLTRANNELVIDFDPAMSGNGSPPWAAHKQPIVLLCSATGYARYVPVMDGGVTPLMPTAGGRVTAVLPIGQGSAGGWVERNTALDLRRVKRIEIMVEPSDAGSPNVSFDIEFLQLGFQ